MYSVNFSEVIHPKKTIEDEIQAIKKAYYGGLIANHGTLTIYGTGAERGTFFQFANICMNGVSVALAKEAITYFTNIYSTALRNQCKTHKKKKFYLSQIQEIKPMLIDFGLDELFQTIWNQVEKFDMVNDLRTEYVKFGKISNWQNRTMRIDIPLISFETIIMDSIVSNLPVKFESEDIPCYAFIEGFHGITLINEDLPYLLKGENILSRYEIAA